MATITVELESCDTAHAFRLAAEQAKDIIWESKGENAYKFDLTLVSTTLQYYDFGDRNTFLFKFRLDD